MLFSQSYRRLSLVVLLVLVLAVLVGPARLALATGEQAPSNTVNLWVQYHSGRAAEVRGALAANGANIRHDFPSLNAYAVTMPAAAASGLSSNPHVALVEEDVERTILMDGAPTAFDTALAIAGATGQPEQLPYGVTMVQGPDAWAAGYTGTNRTVCIIDTGFYRDHEDLHLGSRLLGGVTQQSTGWWIDGNGHGTHVAGTIAGVDNTVGVVGVAPNVNLYIVKFFNDDGVATLSSDLVAGAYSCRDGGANIISMSLGGGRSSRTEETAFNDLHNNYNILSVAAAGNDGTTALSYPASYPIIMSVAALDSSKVVASFSQKNAQVDVAAPGVGVLSTVPYRDTATATVGGNTFSGIPVEFAALTNTSGVTGSLVSGGLCDATNAGWAGKVVLCERGVISFFDKVMNVQNSGGVAALIYNNVANEDLHATLGDGNSSSIPAIGYRQDQGQAMLAYVGQSTNVVSTHEWPVSDYAYYDGTSMATPHVSAVAALVWSAVPTATNSEVRAAIEATAQDLGAAGRDDSYGWGLVQANAAIAYLQGSGGGGDSLHIGDLDVTTAKSGRSWKATVTALVVDQNGSPVSGAVVSVTASGGFNGTGSCTTGAAGTCSLATGKIAGTSTSVTFTVTNVAKTGYTYDSAANADPDGDSNGTSITATKP